MRRLIKGLGFIVAALAIFAGILAAIYRDEIARLRAVNNLFEPDVIVENFRTMDTLFEYQVVRRGDDVWELPAGTQILLPETFAFGNDKTMNTAEFLDYTNTTGLIVLHDGKVVFEKYFKGETPETRHISWSVAKSFTSALVGITLHEGLIKDVQDPVTVYAPVLATSGYNNVPLKHVLQMSSGIGFNEDYADFYSDINRMGRTLAMRTPITDFVCSLKKAGPSGVKNHYVSMDTQVLCMVLRQTTGKSLTELTEEKLWRPIGMESDAYWLTDATGMELAFGCLNAVLRDYARFGLLYMNGGKRGDLQIVPAEWVRASTTPDGAHVQPKEDVTSPLAPGYGYQWWVPAGNRGDFLAQGVYNQMIYVDPRRRVVIAKTSANHHYLDDDYISEPQTTELCRAIAAQFPLATEVPQSSE